MSTARIIVIGAGAIGCFVGGKLAAAGIDVTLVGRARTAAALRSRGLELRVAGGATQTVRSVAAAATVREAFLSQCKGPGSASRDVATASLPSPFDLAILAVKSYDSAAALDELAEAAAMGVAPLPPVLSLQNGVGNEEAIAARLGPNSAIAGTITAPVEVLEPATVQVTKPRFAVGLAPWMAAISSRTGRHDEDSASKDQVYLPAISRYFTSAGIPAKIYADAPGMKWSKLIMNMIGNATSAILAEPPGVTFADPRIANIEIDALREALRVMAAAGIPLLNMEKYPLGTLAPLLRFGPRALLRPALHRIVGGARGGKMPSLFLDLDAGKSGSEIGWYNGAIVSKGEEVGLETPVNLLLTQTVRQLVARPQLRAAWRGNFDRLARAAHSG